jgi:Integrase zinc binding domain/Integrase core domain
MNKEVYYGLTIALANGVMPEDVEDGVKHILSRIINQYIIIGTTLYHKKTNRMVIPEHKMEQILKLAHGHPMGGHLGIKNTIHRIAHNYFWPGMKHDIIKYVSSCETCQKRRKGKIQTVMQPARMVAIPFYHVGIDVIGPLPITSQGNRYVILAVDFFSKWVEAKAVDKADAHSVAQFLYDEIICRHGVPKELTSDRGSEFVNNLIHIMVTKFEIKHIRTTAYHPQGNGQTERTNKTMKDILSKLVHELEKPWDYFVSSALFALRTIRQESTRFSPFEILQGRIPRDPAVTEELQESEDSWENLIWEHVRRDVLRLESIRLQAADFIKRSQDNQKAQADKRSKEVQHPLHIGDKVLLYRNLVETTWSAKLAMKWDGPYFIQDIKGTSVRLRYPSGSIFPTYVHKSRLKKYQDA